MISFIFTLICIIQIVLLVKNRMMALCFYLAIIPLSYFSILSFTTFDFTRVCGAIIIAYYLRYKSNYLFGIIKHPIFLLYVYIVLNSIFQYLISGDIQGNITRLLIQIFNYTIYFLIAWIIRETFYKKDLIHLFKKYGIKIILFHITIGVYQLISYKFGLPQISIRNFGHEHEQIIPAFNLLGLDIFRVFSFLKEPKHFGALLIVFISILFLFRSQLKVKYHSLVLAMLILLLIATFSTSAWVVFIIFFLSYTFYLSKKNIFNALLGSFLVFAAFYIYQTNPFIREIIQARLFNRLDNPLGDFAEIYALSILEENPIHYIFGFGLGRISFIISKLANDFQYVYMPNSGLLLLICNNGIIGILLEAMVLVPGLKYLFSKRNQILSNFSFVIGILYIQYLVFQPSWLTIYIYSAALLASKINKHEAQNYCIQH